MNVLATFTNESTNMQAFVIESQNKGFAFNVVLKDLDSGNSAAVYLFRAGRYEQAVAKAKEVLIGE